MRLEAGQFAKHAFSMPSARQVGKYAPLALWSVVPGSTALLYPASELAVNFVGPQSPEILQGAREGLEPVRNIVRAGAEKVQNYFSPPPAKSWAARNAPMLAAAGLLGGAGLYSMMGDD